MVIEYKCALGKPSFRVASYLVPLFGVARYCKKHSFLCAKKRGIRDKTSFPLKMKTRAYRPAEGGERACNSRKSCIEGKMLVVTKFKSKSDVDHAL